MNAENAFTSINTYGIWAAIVFVVLGLVAVFLAVVIYILGQSEARQIAKAASEVGSAVDRIEKLFDRLHADTSLMRREPYSDLQTNTYTESGPSQNDALKRAADSYASKKAVLLEEKTFTQIRRLMGARGRSPEDIERLLHDIEPVIAGTIAMARNTESEAGEEAIKAAVVDVVSRSGKAVAIGMQMGAVYQCLKSTFDEHLALGDLLAELYILRYEDRVKWKGHMSDLNMDTFIRLKR